MRFLLRGAKNSSERGVSTTFHYLLRPVIARDRGIVVVASSEGAYQVVMDFSKRYSKVESFPSNANSIP